MGTKKTLTCGCRGMKVIHLHEGETKELVHKCQGGQIINTCVYAVNQAIKMCACVWEGYQEINTCVWGRELIHVYGGGANELIHVYGGGDQGINTCVCGRGTKELIHAYGGGRT